MKSSRCPNVEVSQKKPSYGLADLESVLLSETRIANRVSELAKEISSHYGSKDITIICVLSGALVFTSDLIRKLKIPTRLDCLRSDSYGNSTKANSPPCISSPLKTDIENQHVLLVDDILDTGNTLSALMEHLIQSRPASLRTCVLLDKKERRQLDIQADHVGFTIPDAFVVGYGLDFAERYRTLPCIGVLKPEFQKTSSF